MQRREGKQQWGGCWQPPGIFKEESTSCPECVHPLGPEPHRGFRYVCRAWRARRTGSSASGPVVSCDGQGSQVWTPALPLSLHHRAPHPPCAQQGRDCLCRVCRDGILGVGHGCSADLCILLTCSYESLLQPSFGFDPGLQSAIPPRSLGTFPWGWDLEARIWALDVLVSYLGAIALGPSYWTRARNLF